MKLGGRWGPKSEVRRWSSEGGGGPSPCQTGEGLAPGCTDHLSLWPLKILGHESSEMAVPQPTHLRWGEVGCTGLEALMKSKL